MADEDDEELNCFGCGGGITQGMDTFISEPCPDVLGRQHFWHVQCWMCHKMHGAFPNPSRCSVEIEDS